MEGISLTGDAAGKCTEDGVIEGVAGGIWGNE